MSDRWFYALRHYRWNNAMVLSVSLIVLVTLVAALGTAVRPLVEWPLVLRASFVAALLAIPLPLLVLYLHRYLSYRAALLIADQHDAHLQYVAGYHALDRKDDDDRLNYLFRGRHQRAYVMVTMAEDWWVASLSAAQAQEWLDGLGSSGDDGEQP